MAKGITNIQSELLGGSFFNQFSDNVSEYEDIETLPISKQIVIKTIGEFIIEVKENLKRLGKVYKGGLEDDISSSNILENENGFKVIVGYDTSKPASKYYDYVNKGVKGYDSGQPSDSPYAFKNYRNKRNAPLIGRQFSKAIEEWVVDNSIKSAYDDQKYNMSALQAKRKTIKDMASPSNNTKKLAYAIAVGIKKKGIAKTDYFDSAVDKYFGGEFIKLIAKATGEDVRVYIKTFENRIKRK